MAGAAGRRILPGLPLLVALASIFIFLATPVTNTIVRTTEHQADIFGLDAVRKPDAFATVMLKLSTYRKLEPGKWEEIDLLRPSFRPHPHQGRDGVEEGTYPRRRHSRHGSREIRSWLFAAGVPPAPHKAARRPCVQRASSASQAPRASSFQSAVSEAASCAWLFRITPSSSILRPLVAQGRAGGGDVHDHFGGAGGGRAFGGAGAWHDAVIGDAGMGEEAARQLGVFGGHPQAAAMALRHRRRRHRPGPPWSRHRSSIATPPPPHRRSRSPAGRPDACGLPAPALPRAADPRR